MIHYQITYARRKTIGIQIKNGLVEVRAPFGYPEQLLFHAVNSRLNWIEAKLQQVADQERSRAQFAQGRDMEAESMAYRRRAETHIPERVAHFAQIMGVTVKKVSINGAKTRWGSCSTTGRLNFSWRLMMASDAAIDYVVVHELAHLKQMNHSPQFWALVAQVLPDYQQQKAQLKALSKRIQLEGW